VLPFIYDYAVGVWWLLALLLTFGSANDVRECLIEIERWTATAPHVRPPDLILNATLLIIVVVAPYLVAMAVYPFVNILMNWLLRFQIKIRNRGLPQPPPLPRPLRRAMRVSPRDMLRKARIADPKTTRSLISSLHHIQLRVNTIVPTAALAAFAIRRLAAASLVPIVSSVLAIAFSFVVVLVLSWSANDSYLEFLREIDLLPRFAEMRRRREGTSVSRDLQTGHEE
jgi:hypothetical protein